MAALRRTLQRFASPTLPSLTSPNLQRPTPRSNRPPTPPASAATSTSSPPEPRAALEKRLAARTRNPFVWGRRTMTSDDWERRWGITDAQRKDLPGGMHPGRLWELSQARERRGQPPRRKAVDYPSLQELGLTPDEFLATTVAYSDDLDVHACANGYRHIKRPFTPSEDASMLAVLADGPLELLTAPFDRSSPNPEQVQLLTKVARAVPMHSLRKVRRHVAKQAGPRGAWVELRARSALEGLVKEVLGEREPEVDKLKKVKRQTFHSKWNRGG